MRIEECAGEAAALRSEVQAWWSGWDLVDAAGAHLTHLDTVATVVTGLVDEIAGHIATIPTGDDPATYEECRREDLRLLHARRLWRWYADKLDQRAGPPESDPVRTLLAADEIVWSCWKSAFAGLGAPVPAAPIPYLSAQWSATATPRSDPPPELRPGRDDLLRSHIELLPVPVVGLPPVCTRRPWWLVLCGHETAHHVQFELAAGLEERTQEAVVAAAYGVLDDVEAAERWRPWCRELFADALSVLLLGPAAGWAVGELDTRPDPHTSPGGGYPPPELRFAVLDAVAAAACLPGTGLSTGPAPEVAEPVAGALLGLAPTGGATLATLATATAAAYRDGVVADWSQDLLGPGDPLPERRLTAARFAIAAGVDAWTRAGGAVGTLAGRLTDFVRLSAEPGTRGGIEAPDPAAVSRRFGADLYSVPVEELR